MFAWLQTWDLFLLVLSWLLNNSLVVSLKMMTWDLAGGIGKCKFGNEKRKDKDIAK